MEPQANRTGHAAKIRDLKGHLREGASCELTSDPAEGAERREGFERQNAAPLRLRLDPLLIIIQGE